MKFKNRPNQCIFHDDGTEIWISRSVVVAVCAVLIKEDQPYILVNQRGPGLPNAQYQWNLPCGYLDYDETTQEAAVREVWEECGVDLNPLMSVAKALYFEVPWDVSSTPLGEKQNVTIHHGVVTEVEALPQVSNAYNEPDETVDIRWAPLSDTVQLDFAFNHFDRIKKFIEHIKKDLNLDYRRLLQQ